MEKKGINERREAARAAAAATEHAARMQVEYKARMAAEQPAWMASGEWSGLPVSDPSCSDFDFILACLDC